MLESGLFSNVFDPCCGSGTFLRPHLIANIYAILYKSAQYPEHGGLGQIGNEQRRGVFLQTVLAVVPQSREVLGCAMQEPVVRTPVPQGETRS